MNSKEYNFIKDNLYYGIYTDNTEPIIDICKRVIRSYNNKKVLNERIFDILYPNQYTSEARIKHELNDTFIGTLKYRKYGREPFTINTMIYLIHKRLLMDEHFKFVSDDINYQYLICLLISVNKIKLTDQNGDQIINVDSAFALITGDKWFERDVDGLRLDNDFQQNFRWTCSDTIFYYDKKNQPRFKLNKLNDVLGINRANNQHAIISQ
jgi:hypothetical protein